MDHSHGSGDAHEHSHDGVACAHDHSDSAHEHAEHEHHGHSHDGVACGHDHSHDSHGHGHEHSHAALPRLEGLPGDDLSGDGGLLKTVDRAGDAEKGTPPAGSKVKVHYVGTLLDGTKFDSSRDRPGHFEFTIGQGQVIKGWDVGVGTMHKGEVATLICRHDYAYGASGHPPAIPPNATLKF
jgi:hypothetical protein